MSSIQIGLADKTGEIDPSLLQAVAAALNIQAARDLPSIWPVAATVEYLSNPKEIPVGVWPIFLVKKLPPGEGGFHLDKHNQPYAEVIASPQSDEWTIDASHEMVEMLVDPNGNKMQSAKAIQISGDDVVDADGQFSYLVEAADPCEADGYGYKIQGVAVSDFITPRFYDPVLTENTKYSFTGAIKRPRQVLPGGYISYIDLATNEWKQILWVDPTKPPQYNDLGPGTQTRSHRLWIDNHMFALHEEGAKRDHALLEECRSIRANLAELARVRGTLFER